MADRRMLSKKVVNSDEFLEMPPTAQVLYFYLNMEADDDGFVSNPKSVIRMVGAKEDDFKILIAKRFIIWFESKVIVITHWKMHNYIQADRYHPTIYQEEKSLLALDKNKVYQFSDWKPAEIEDVSNMDTDCIQDGYKTDTEVRLGKVRLGKGRKDNTISPEPSAKASGPPADVEAIPLNDGTEWKPAETDYREWSRLYPGVDVKQQFREMRSWSMSNPTRRKTKSGVKRFVNTWLSKEQNRSRGGTNGERGYEVDPLGRYGYSSYGDRASPSG